MKSRFLIFALIIILAFFTGWLGFQYITKENLESAESEILTDSIPGRGFYRIARILEFDEMQLEKYVAMESNYRTELYQQTQRIREFESLIVEEFSKSVPDEEALTGYASEIGKMQGSIKLLTIDHFMALREICNPEQIERLTVLFDDLQQRPAFRRGRDGQGRGEGRHRFGREN